LRTASAWRPELTEVASMPSAPSEHARAMAVVVAIAVVSACSGDGDLSATRSDQIPAESADDTQLFEPADESSEPVDREPVDGDDPADVVSPPTMEQPADDAGIGPTGSAFFAAAPGDVADATDGDVGGASVPTGSVTNDLDDTTSLWISDAPNEDPNQWSALAEMFASTGLWPVHLEPWSLDLDVPWRSGEFGPPESVSDVAVVDILSTWSRGEPIEVLAEPSELTAVAELSPTEFGLEAASLGLIPVQRPADVVAVIGWSGSANADQTPGEVSAVLRSWEDRFGAYVTRLGFASMYLSVTRPPEDPDVLMALAAEHFAWCPSIDEFGVPLEIYAEEIAGATEWVCWWD
ncbi:MAG: DUF4253 domain-containing protein, partial [Ilumatobacter sp.]